MNMIIKSNKIYIDYLDYTVSGNWNLQDSISRLKFDLLLFSEEELCLSVPACVKLNKTTDILMRLTPFWKNKKIRLILDKKHRGNPWNYFNNRNRKLEKEFNEFDLKNHFEYRAYAAPHTSYFYNVFIKDIVNKTQSDLYIGKIFDTDEMFRRSIISQVNDNADNICGIMPIELGIHMGKIFNDLIIVSEDRKSLFQRMAVEEKLVKEYGAETNEVKIISKILDKGFSYANGVSSYAAPLSLITNRLTGKQFIQIIKYADEELYKMIDLLGWNAIYRLSIDNTWLDFIDHLNRLLYLYQNSEKNYKLQYRTIKIGCDVITKRIVEKLYESAIKGLQKELFKSGAFIGDVMKVKEKSDELVEYYLKNKNEYWDVIKQVDELIPAIKVIIRSLDRRYKDSTLLIREEGYNVSLDDGLF